MSKTVLKKTYTWYEIGVGGSLESPEPQGPHYSREYLNPMLGFNTEEDAVARLHEWCEEYNIHSEFVLLPTYSRE